MSTITIRTRLGQSSSDDLTVPVKQNTFDYLLTSDAPTVRISAYLDRDLPAVKDNYAEVYVSAECTQEYKILWIKAGSKIRKGVTLPGEMKEGEQLVIETARTSRDSQEN